MASAMDRKLRIAHAVEALGLKEQKIFTLGELEAIARKADAPLREVMKYLRSR